MKFNEVETLIEDVNYIKFRYTNSKHDRMPRVCVLDLHYDGKKYRGEKNTTDDVLGWNTNYFSNPKEARKTIDDITSFAKLMDEKNKPMYERIKKLFPKQSEYIRRYKKEHIKGLKEKKHGLWWKTNYEKMENNNLW